MLIVVLGIGFIFLWTIRSILSPLIWAMIVAYILDPVVDWMARRLRVRRVLIVVLLTLVLLGSLVLTFFAIRFILVRELRDLIFSIPRIAGDIQDYILGTQRIDIFGVIIDPNDLRSEISRAIQDNMSGLGRMALPFVVRAVGSVVHLFLFLISTFYLLLDFDKIGPAIVNFLPRRWRRDIIPLLRDSERVLGSYIRGQVFLILIMTVASWLVLTVLQIRYSLLLAIITGVVEIFPVIGPWTAGGIAVSVALTQPTALFNGSSTLLAIAVGLAYFSLRQLEDIFVIPNVVGKVMELHPLVVLFALTAGSYLAGILGLLIAVPIAAVVKVYLRFVHQKLIEEEQAEAREHHGADE